jgi:hypothetical protein
MVVVARSTLVHLHRLRGTEVIAALPRWALLLFCVALAAWRLDCVTLGPDPDTDAYGHYVIARQMLETPTNLRIHWVWLPFYHGLVALAVAAGATLDHVRSGNALLGTAIPLLLWWELSRNTPRQAGLLERAVPYLAALLAAAAPIGMQLGTTGQMEVFFTFLLLAAAAFARREQYGYLALVLSVAVLTRYEAWAVVAAVAAVSGFRRLVAGTPIPRGVIGAVLGPGACVLAWAALRWRGGEPWFGFILDNQAFAEGVLERHAPADWQLAALGRYVFTVPLRVLGVVAIFAALGVWRSLHKEGIWWVALPAAVLFFLTLSSLTRSQLGLDRHFYAVVPFAATWAAHGVGQIASWVGASSARRFTVPSFALLAGYVVGGALLGLETWMGEWRQVTRTALPEARAAGQFLRTTPPGSVIVCDEASVEVLSGLASERFVRAHVAEGSRRHLAELSRGRDVFVVSRASRVGALEGWGALAFGTPDAPGEAFVALHIPARTAQVSSGTGMTTHQP